MARGTIFICDRCQQPINDMKLPVIVCINVGHVNGGGVIEWDAEDGIDDFTTELLGSGDMRREYCAGCWQKFFRVCDTEVAECRHKRESHEIRHGLRPPTSPERIELPPAQALPAPETLE